MNIEKLENHLTHHTIVLVRHLVKHEQAKNRVVLFISEVLHITKEESLQFYKKYQKELGGPVT